MTEATTTGMTQSGATATGAASTSTGTSGSAGEKAQAAKDAATQTAATAKDEAAGVASQAAQSGSQVAATAKEQGGQVVAEAAAQARDLVTEVRNQANGQVLAQKDNAVTGLRGIADELEAMLNGQGAQGGVAGELARQAATRAHSIATWIESREPADLLDEVKTFARRRPGAFLLGAAVAGVLAGRATRGGVAAAHQSSSTGSSGSSFATGTYAPDTQSAYAAPSPVIESYPTPGAGTGYATTGTGVGGTIATTTGTTGYAEDVYTSGSTGTGYAPSTMEPPLETIDVRPETSDPTYGTGSGYGGQR